MSGVFLKNLEELRKVEWARSWTWDIQFSGDVPKPFSKWFPATDVEEGLYNLEPFTFTGGYGSFSVPKNWSPLTLSITFVDSAYHTIENWLEEWVNHTILGDGLHIACLETAVKKVTLVKLDNKREIVSENSYLVFPTGPLSYTGSSSADIPSHQVEFTIAKIISRKVLKQYE